MENSILAKVLNGDDRSPYRNVVFLMKLASEWPSLNSGVGITKLLKPILREVRSEIAIVRFPPLTRHPQTPPTPAPSQNFHRISFYPSPPRRALGLALATQLFN